MFGGEQLTEDATVNPLAELMLVEKCLEKIDPRLPNHVMQTRGYLMQNEGKTLFCVRQLLWNQVATKKMMTKKMLLHLLHSICNHKLLKT